MDEPPASSSVIVNLGTIDQIPPGHMKSFQWKGQRILVCKIGDQFYAIEDKCTHDDAPLGKGCLDGEEVECPRHGARFSVKTGEPTALPAVEAVKTFPIRVVGNQIQLVMEG